MNKTLRIVAKDARHLWPEILVSLAITAGFIATDHFGWPQYSNYPFRAGGALRSWMQVLMPITWWLLVSRAVHDESLVGDRQFWITRPYGWPRVLAAKLIFIATFILFPYLLAQIILLQEAHLHPLNVLPGLAFTLAALFVLFVLPLLALATVTATISRIFIIFFGLVVYTGLAVYFGTAFGAPPAWTPGSDAPYLEVAIIIALIIPAIVTVLQYSQRRTHIAVALLLALVAIVTAGGIADHYARRRIADFPALSATEAAPFRASLDPDPRRIHPSRTYAQLQAENRQNDQSPIDVPIIISAIDPKHAVNIDAQTVTISADGHPNSTIPWESQARPRMFPALSGPFLGDSHLDARIPRWVYREFADKKITLHLTYAVTEFEAESPHQTVYTDQGMDLPENGRCSLAKNYMFDQPHDLVCQYALTSPSLTHVTWNLSENCNPVSGSSVSRQTWIGDTTRGLRELSISPVIRTFSGFSTAAAKPGSPGDYNLCPGSTFTFTKYHILRRRMVEVTLPPIDPTIYIPPPGHQPLPPFIPPPGDE